MGSPTLILIPTELERRRIADDGGLPVGLGLVELCGFGPIAAAARTAELITRVRPSRVMLIGIAGSYDVELFPVGTALEFDDVAVEGVGVGEGQRLIAPPALGFPQWPGHDGRAETAIFDTLKLATEHAQRPRRSLLTTCAASADAQQAAQRRERFPAAVAEDMEGFAVATACALAGVPLRIVRGISNLVGDRAPERWRIPTALTAARRLAVRILESETGWSTRR